MSFKKNLSNLLRRHKRSILLSAVVISSAACFLYFRPTSYSHAAAKPSPIPISIDKREGAAPAPSPEEKPSVRPQQPTIIRDRGYVVDNLSKDFNRFLAMSKAGDIQASRALLDALVKCKNADISQRSLTIARDRLEKETNTQERGALADQIRFHQNILSYCGEGSGGTDRKSALRFVTKQLAESGDSDARLKYPMLGQPENDGSPDFDERRSEFISDAKKYLANEISAGNSAALNVMAQAYMPPPVEGMITPFTVDSGKAYTYYYAFGLASPEKNIPRHIESILAGLENKLSPEEIEEHRREAARIASCCGGG
ncbi:MAG: hypothetical protein GXC76_06140 [Rhodanobacteraceae bacterium]|jgi:hypothetical protein|nr:hypothetical protein [Rhodanobacteraceae bacterium]